MGFSLRNPFGSTLRHLKPASKGLKYANESPVTGKLFNIAAPATGPAAPLFLSLGNAQKQAAIERKANADIRADSVKQLKKNKRQLKKEALNAEKSGYNTTESLGIPSEFQALLSFPNILMLALGLLLVVFVGRK